MGWFSSVGDFFGKLGESVGGSLSLQDASAGWSTYSASQTSRKDQMRREMDMAKYLSMDGPSWTMEGLRKAGINPILAADSINSWSGQHGSLGTQAPSGGSSLNFKSRLDRDTTKKQQENIDADTTLKEDQGKAATIQAQAALEQAQAAKLNAMNSSKRVDAEVKLMEKQGSSLDVRNPNESGWGVADRVLGYSGDLLHSAGTAAAIYGVAKGYVDRNKPYLVNVKDQNGRMTTQMYHPKSGLYTPPPSPKANAHQPGFWNKTVNAAKKAGPVIAGIIAAGKKAALNGAKAGAYGAAAYGTVKAMEKAQKTVKEDKKSDYNQKPYHRRLPNAFGIPNYW